MNSRDLDNHITGHYGEDQLKGDVNPAEYKAWAQDIKERALINAAPAPSPKWYARLHDLMERLAAQAGVE